MENKKKEKTKEKKKKKEEEKKGGNFFEISMKGGLVEKRKPHLNVWFGLG
jgi:hypothetical protein